MENYRVFVLKADGMFFWTGRKWDLRPYNAKCYGMKKHAEKAMATAGKLAINPEIVEATIRV